MKSSSVVKFGAALCASVALIPATFAQSPAPDPERNPSGRYPSQSPGTSEDAIQQARERELVRKGEAQSAMGANLDRAKEVLSTATFTDRKQVVDTLEDSIKASKKEEKMLKKSADNLGESTRTEFDAAAKVAETRREALKSSCDDLNDAKIQEWDVRKREVSNNIDLYQQAMDHARKAAGQPMMSRAMPKD